MIAPRTPLLILAGTVFLPLAAVATLVPAAAVLCAVGLALAFGLAAWDAAQGVRLLRRLSVRLPELIRCTKEVEFDLGVEIANETAAQAAVQVAPRMPPDIASAAVQTVAAVPGRVRIPWPCTPRERGDFRVDEVDLERASPWSLWSVRTIAPASCEVRVYPNLRNADTRALFLNRESAGMHRLRQIGMGREFEKLRDYAPGDPYDSISWKATARRGHPVVQVYQLERTQEVYVLVDASRLSARHGVLEKYVVSALHLGLAAQKQGDLFGLIAFSDKIHQFVRARNGKAHYRTCREAIYKLKPRRVSPDFEELFSFIQATLRRRALLVFLTALDDPLLAESFSGAVHVISRRHLVLANVVETPGIQPLFEGEPPATPDDVYDRFAGHLSWKKTRALQLRLERQGVRFAVLDPEKLSAQLTSAYLDVKRRQAI